MTTQANKRGLERTIELVKNAPVRTALKDRGDRLTWFYGLNNVPQELSGWSMTSYPTESEAVEAAEHTRAAYIRSLEYALEIHSGARCQ